MIELRQLHHALALAEHANFARAAAVLHITQPALTRSIQNLEHELGARLFDRNARKVVLTEIGRVALNHAQAIAIASRDLKRDVALAKGLDLGELRIGVGPFGGSALIGPVTGQLSRLHPGLDINLLVSPWNELPSRLRRREVDLIIGEITGLSTQDDMDVVQLHQHSMYFVVRRDHPLAAERSVSYAQAFSYPTAAPRLPEHIKAEFERSLSPALLEKIGQRGFPKISCDSSSILKTILLNSDAISIMAPFMIEDELRSGSLVAVPGIELNLSVRFGIARVKGRTPSAPAIAFETIFLNHDKKLAEGARLLLRDAGRKRKPEPEPVGGAQAD